MKLKSVVLLAFVCMFAAPEMAHADSYVVYVGYAYRRDVLSPNFPSIWVGDQSDPNNLVVWFGDPTDQGDCETYSLSLPCSNANEGFDKDGNGVDAGAIMIKNLG